MTVIYVDVLVIVNIYIGYFLLAATSRILAVSVHKLRLIVGCIVSGFSSLIILLEMNLLELLIVRLLLSVIICFAVYYKKNWRLLIKSIIVFYIVNFLFGGVMYLANSFVKSDTLDYRNGVCYLQINLLNLAIYTIIAYLVISMFDYLFKRRCQKSEIYQVKVCYNGREAMLTAFLDTGNKLIDVLTGLPVMVCELSALESFLPAKLFNYFHTRGADLEDVSICKGVRVIPLRVISGETSLMAFKPQEVNVGGNRRDMLIAVTDKTLSDGSYNAIIPA